MYKKTVNLIIYVAICFLLFTLIDYHLKIINFPYQISYREMVELYRTKLISDGLNIYQLDSYPRSHSIYGFVFNYLVLGICNLFDLQISLFAQRIIVGVFIICSSLIVMSIIYIKIKSLILSILGFLLMYATSMNGDMVGAYPNATGVFFFLTSIYIPFRNNYNNQSLLFSLFFSILSFFTKLYFVLGLFYVLTYTFLYVSKKRAIIFSILSILIFLFSLVIVNWIYPNYLNATIFYLGHNNFNFNYLHLIKQTIHYSVLNYGLVVILIMYIVEKLSSSYNIFSKYLIKRIIEFDYLKIKISFNEYCLFLSVIIITAKLGGNVGAYLSYYLQLLSPFLIIFALTIASNKRYLKTITITILGLINVVYINSRFIDIDINDMYNKYSAIDNDLLKYQNVFHSPAISSNIIKNGLELYDTGQTAYAKFLSGSLKNKYDEYIYMLREKVKGKEFDAIYSTDNDKLFLIPEVDLVSNYNLITSFDINMINQHWKVNKWLPKNQINDIGKNNMNN